ncbi:MAG TPA: hypothetical protein VGH15_08385 [Caulobacteraceae bacterium]|jgi:hypothetical protein
MIYIQDDRYKTTTLEVVLAPTDKAASELARMCLDSSPHYLAVEVWADEKRLLRIEKEGQFPAPPITGNDDAAQEEGE